MGFSSSLLSLLTLAVAGSSVNALLLPVNTTQALVPRTVEQPGEGTFDGFFWSSFVTSGFDVIFTNINGGQYETQWSGSGDFVTGQGWNPGSATRSITFSASWEPNPSSSAILSVYGWSTNPLVEYYVNEEANNFNLGTINSGTNFKGSFTSDGSVYNVYEHQQVNQPSIQGTATFQQYLSVRQSPRTSGTVTFANHVAAWKSFGMNLGTLNYQIVAVEGLSSSGQATVTIS